MLEIWLSSRGEVKSQSFWSQTRKFCPCLRIDALGEFLVLKKKKKINLMFKEILVSYLQVSNYYQQTIYFF